MRRLVRRVLGGFGLELRRRSARALPRLLACHLAGESFPFWIANEHAERWWGTGAVRWDTEMAFLRRAARPGAIIIEVGAHHGMHTVQLARWSAPGGAVHAFELDPANALVLSANVAANRGFNVEVTLGAVGDRVGEIAAAGERVDGRGLPVACTTLDEYCRAHAIERVDLLKIDVEGFEARVLSGAPRVLSSRPWIDLELHLDDLDRYGDSVEGVLNLVPAGYAATMMVRPDWHTERPYRSTADLPRSGVVNLFFGPQGLGE